MGTNQDKIINESAIVHISSLQEGFRISAFEDHPFDYTSDSIDPVMFLSGDRQFVTKEALDITQVSSFLLLTIPLQLIDSLSPRGLEPAPPIITFFIFTEAYFT